MRLAPKLGALSAAAAISTAVAGFAVPSASASETQACSLISASKVEKVLGLSHIKESSHSIEPSSVDPENNSGSVSSECKVLVWSGSIPTTANQVAAKLRNGTGAQLVINTRAEDTGSPEAAKWQMPGFEHEFDAVITGGSAAAHGKHFATPDYSAESAVGYVLVKQRTSEALGVWADPLKFAFMDMDLLAGKRGPTQLDAIAKIAVPACL